MTTNLLDYKFYVGQSQNDDDWYYYGSGINIKHSLDKYGKENFKKITGKKYPNKKCYTMETKLKIKYTYATGNYTRAEVAEMFDTSITMVKRCRNLKEISV